MDKVGKIALVTVVSGLLLVTGLPKSSAASAQTYPTRAIRLIVPTPPGGGTDTVARIVGQNLSGQVSQQIVTDNRIGASGNIAAQIAAKATPDGHTLLVILASHATNPSLFKNLGYDPIKDFAPITRLTGLPYLLVVHPSLPVKNVKELIATAKTTKDSLSYASGGAGLLGHLSMELLKDLGNFEAVHVAYKGGAAAMLDVAAGRVCCFFASAPSALPHVRSGRVRVIGVSANERSALVPDVPTIAEQGFPKYDVVSWYGLLAPAGTPKDIVAFLHKEVVNVLRMEDTKKKLTAVGAAPAPSESPEQFRAYIQSEIETWRRVIKRAGITAQ